MNLIDLIKRKDRSITSLSPTILISSHVREGFSMQSVVVPSGSYIRIENVHEFGALKSYPVTMGWKWSGLKKCSSPYYLKLIILNELEDFRHVIFSAEINDYINWHEIVLNWPTAVGQISNYSMIITCTPKEGRPTDRSAAAVIGISPPFNSRCYIPELIKGVGVEIGPGLNPHILPSKDVEIKYVESLTAEEWIKLYKKTDKPPVKITDELWAKYIISNATNLENIKDGSLDFIFSNHVFEHFMNPIGVLENWSRKLHPNGVVYNVIPNAHSCFDLRQPLSNREEWIQEYDMGKWEPDLGKYERWCAYTAPYNTPQNLIERKYSIHVQYYSPHNATQLAELLMEKGLYSGHYIGQAWNHKDFAMVLFKGKLKRV